VTRCMQVRHKFIKILNKIFYQPYVIPDTFKYQKSKLVKIMHRQELLNV